MGVKMIMSEGGRPLRLFFALIADKVQEPLAEVYSYLNKFPHALKTVAPQNYHITLKFLGETGIDTYKKLRDDFARLTLKAGPIGFKLQGLGGFPDEKRARVIWCGLITDLTGVRTIYERIENVSEKHGFKKEGREFTPHYTLARTRRDRKLPNEIIRFLSENKHTFYGESHFRSIVLFKSELGTQGSRYTALEEVPL
jgi:RNA 2',3'-cyclic 3'-phosphodiesterase